MTDERVLMPATATKPKEKPQPNENEAEPIKKAREVEPPPNKGEAFFRSSQRGSQRSAQGSIGY